MKNRLSEVRRCCGMTQKELSERSGISRPYLAKIECGAQRVYTNVVMEKLARALGAKVTEVFYSDGVNYSERPVEEAKMCENVVHCARQETASDFW